ncbi:MAG: DUF1214 domain-containing protein [Sphingomonadales bacterium]|nr:DUF1214 domain-containing protein [Sphingomonadales bacterium]
MTDRLPPLFDLLGALQGAADLTAQTWRPDDPAYRADIYRQIMMQLSSGYFAWFHATPEHPDWAPLWNPVFTLQPNPDDIYLYCPIDSAYRYRISGQRGTVKLVTFTTQRGLPGLPWGIDTTGADYNDLDDGDLVVADDGSFELLLSTERPAGHAGNWLRIAPDAHVLMTRYRSYDWLSEVDPVLSIECLDRVPPKPRPSVEDILARVRGMVAMPADCQRLFYAMQNDIRARVGVNTFEPVKLGGSFTRQVYLPAVFEFAPDEALILETELPAQRRYWNFQLNDPYFNAIEYVYRLSSTNGHFARVSDDGKFRAVIALQDPGVPNWLDPAGYTEGTIYGRWYDCDSCPTPVLKRVKFAELSAHLPPDTPRVTPAERDSELRARVRACQRRRRW